MKYGMITIALGVLSAGSLFTGCASHHALSGGDGVQGDAGSAVLDLEPEAYQRVFDLARETLRDYRFSIDRVDAKRGVLTTHPKRTNGLASPWDQEQSSLGQEWEDLFNEQRRVVRVDFDRDATPMTMRVTVELLRTHRPNWRVESESVRLSTHARSRDALGQVEPGSSVELVGLDEQFARRIVESIEQHLGASITSAAGAP